MLQILYFLNLYIHNFYYNLLQAVSLFYDYGLDILGIRIIYHDNRRYIFTLCCYVRLISYVGLVVFVLF
jgi:hypothetical protein